MDIGPPVHTVLLYLPVHCKRCNKIDWQ